MPLKNSDLNTGVIAVVTVKYETADGKVHEFDVGYYPERITPKLVKSLQQTKDGEQNLDAGAELLVELVAWQDILDDNGQRIPPSLDYYTGKSFPLQAAIATAIMEAITRPMRKSGSN